MTWAALVWGHSTAAITVKAVASTAAWDARHC
jgi:hypothetical protein